MLGKDREGVKKILLVIDVGNTNTFLGLYDGEELVHDWRIRTVNKAAVDLVFFGIPGIHV